MKAHAIIGLIIYLQFSTKVHLEFGILGLWKSREFDLWMKKYKKLWRSLLKNL